MLPVPAMVGLKSELPLETVYCFPNLQCTDAVKFEVEDQRMDESNYKY